jgi:hypothetical protein
MSPTCCEKSEHYRTVRFFEPANQSTPSHWVVPLRGEDNKVTDMMSTNAFFCPFCGVKLGRDHIPFEGAETPSGSAAK